MEMAMSEFASSSEPQILPPPPRPEAFVGAASPLWAYYVAAAAGGVAFWWMTRWTRPESLEALFQASAKAPARALDAVMGEARSFAPAAEAAEQAAQAAPAAAAEVAQSVAGRAADGADRTAQAAAGLSQAAAEAPVSVAEALSEPKLPAAPLGGEAAPVSPVLEAGSAAAKEPRSRVKLSPPQDSGSV